MSANAPAPTRPGPGGPLHRLVGWWEARRSGPTLALAWVLTRLAVLGVLALFERFVVGDVFYYHRKIRALLDVGLEHTLNEYPTPVTWLLWLPYGATGGHRVGYLVAFIVFMLALDAAFTVALYRTSGRRHTGPADFWLAFVLLVGPLSYLRFDILPAVLAGGALLAARRRPWVTGALTGLGAAMKLWPALLIPAFLAHRPDRKAAGWAFVGVGFGLAALSLLAGGWSRLVSPLTWQSDRGLQIESVWATPVMLARAVRPSAWLVDISKYQAYEIFGPSVALWLTVATLATVAGLVVIVALYLRAFRNPAPTALAVGLVVLATVAVMTVTNKTLSPQYLLWLGGPMAALLLLARDGTAGQRDQLRRLAGFLLALALLTHLVYPLFYDGLLGRSGHPMVVVSTLVTAVRNLALVVFTVQVVRLAWRWLALADRDAVAG
ncbi:Protein of unknown function [Friedmanniella luteola]|uniref:DUF2029 domain-containing protein n=1 Tax=Friedmanniella luteola TaxID=546871 RepID=A0A1H1V7G1_9ACTN|nr:glycosyltransferase family 87 protein [Friedmanniella luteola]SDS80672.1 Protein of unknown function [Friedmanniella luteola]